MKKGILKILGVFFATTLLSSTLSACDVDYRFLYVTNKTGNWGDDKVYLFAPVDDDDDWWDDDWDDDGGYSSNNNGGNSNNNNNSNSDGYSTSVLNFMYSPGSGVCGVYASFSAIQNEGVENIKVPPTYTDSAGNVYVVQYDCNNGFTVPSIVKTITFSYGFERIDVGFGSSTGLTKIVLPATLLKINCRMLVKCQSFRTIEFKGTKAQWNAIEKIESWNDMAPEFKVSCTDGDITVPVYIES